MPHEACLSFSTDAIRQMVVDESRGLEKGIADRRAEEFESSHFHVPAHGIGFGRRCRYFVQRPERVADRSPAGKERERVAVKTAELFLYGEKPSRIGDGRLDFQPVTFDAVDPHDPLGLCVGHACHAQGVEIA